MRAECSEAQAAWRLVLPSGPLRGRQGERLGASTGASLEFMDYRDYVPGDDLRHVDWRSYARTDQLKVRLFREEVAPTLEILADLSPSMVLQPGKAQAIRDLLGALAEWSRRAAGHPRYYALGGIGFDDADTVAFDQAPTDDLFPRARLRPRSLRVVVSDFLFPGDPAPFLRRLAHGASHLYVLQILHADELAPAPAGLVTLRDCESFEQIEIQLEEAAVRSYQQRLARLRGAVENGTRSVGGSYCMVHAAAPRVMFRSDLMAQGIVEPA